MSPRLDEFTNEQIKFALFAIKARLREVVKLNDYDTILSGNCPEWEDLTLWKVQLTIALERNKKKEQISSN